MSAERNNNIFHFRGVGLALGTVFFAASLTPSLIPRGYIVQGILGGVAFGIGYAIAIIFLSLWRYLQLPEPNARTQNRTHITAVVLSLPFAAWSLSQATEWQNSIRRVMDMELMDSAYPIRVLFLTITSFLILFVLAHGLIAFGRSVSTKINRYIPGRAANLIGALLTIAIVWSLGNGVLVQFAYNILDRSFREYDALIEPDRPQPTAPERTGSEASLIQWKELGRAGREFVASSPTSKEISALTGRDALTPIRVYAGLQVADTPEDRAQLALEELKRQNAFDRAVLVIVTPTGTGWVDPAAMIGLEFLHDGDVASVAMQYSYVNSPLSLLFHAETGSASSRALFLKIYKYWKKLPHNERPRLYLHGLSLGALNSQRSMSLYDILDDPLNGAVWSGSPFQSGEWRSITDARDRGSPEWLPLFQEGSTVRFMNQNGIAPGNNPDWFGTRILYLQYASDAITFFDSATLYREPDWMQAPRGPDVSPELTWYPVVTMLQLAVDMAFADRVPSGYGHVFSPEHYLDAWKEVTMVDNWTPDDMERLKRYLRQMRDEHTDSELRGG